MAKISPTTTAPISAPAPTIAVLAERLGAAWAWAEAHPELAENFRGDGSREAADYRTKDDTGCGLPHDIRSTAPNNLSEALAAVIMHASHLEEVAQAMDRAAYGAKHAVGAVAWFAQSAGIPIPEGVGAYWGRKPPSTCDAALLNAIADFDAVMSEPGPTPAAADTAWRRIVTTEARTPAGILAKLEVALEGIEGGGPSGETSIFDSIKDDLHRMATA